jgi:phage antirepressor YoqD-like protein
MKIKLGKYQLIVFFRTNTYNYKMDRERLGRYRQKRRERGLCKVCGVPVDEINKCTKRKYSSCQECRKRECELKKQQRLLKNK